MHPLWPLTHTFAQIISFCKTALFSPPFCLRDCHIEALGARPFLCAEQKAHPKLQRLTLTARHNYGVVAVCLEAKLFHRRRNRGGGGQLVAKRTRTHSSASCLQAANPRRSTTMPSCKGARVSELG